MVAFYGKMPCLRKGHLELLQGKTRRKDLRNGKVQSLRQGNHLRSQPLFLPTCHQPHVQAQPSEGFGDGERTLGKEDPVRQVHQDTRQISCLSLRTSTKNHGAQCAVIFVLTIIKRARSPRPYAIRISFNAFTPAPLPCGCLNAAFPVTKTFAPAFFINGIVSALMPPSTSRWA